MSIARKQQHIVCLFACALPDRTEEADTRAFASKHGFISVLSEKILSSALLFELRI